MEKKLNRSMRIERRMKPRVKVENTFEIHRTSKTTNKTRASKVGASLKN